MTRSITATAVFLALVSSLSAQEQERRTLSVTGTAEIAVSPDICYMSFTVETQNKSAVEAYTENNVIMNKVNANIKTQGIDAKDMNTSHFSIIPQYHYEDKTNKRIFDGYKVTHTLNVKVRDLSKVSKILDVAVSSGATGVQSIYFTVENPKKYAQEAREEAIQAARAKASQIAKLTGVKLGKPVTISESEPGGYERYPQTSMRMRDGGFAEAEASLEPGEIKLRHTVYITYEIE